MTKKTVIVNMQWDKIDDNLTTYEKVVCLIQ